MLKTFSLRSRFDDHLSRKFFHMIAGVIVAILFTYVMNRKTAVVATLGVSSVFIVLDLIRLRFVGFNQFVMSLYGPLMREEEERAPSAGLFFALGLCWSIACLPRAIALQAILTLSFMDPVAGVIGVRYGKRTWNSIFQRLFVNFKSIPKSLGAKTVEGSFAGLAAAMVAGIMAWTGPWAGVAMANGPMFWPNSKQILILAFSGAITAMVSEAWPSQWDDNANIPFWTGLAVWAVASVMMIPLNFW